MQAFLRNPLAMDEITLHEGKYLRLRQRGRWEYAERTNASSAVIVVAITPDDKVVFVEQYRVPVLATSIEMPAGLVGDLGENEDVLEAARRELEEETGWSAGRIEYLMAGPSSSGMSNEMIAFVRALDLVRVGPGGGDASEQIVVHEVPRDEVAGWLHGKLQDGYSIDPKLYAGLYFIDHNPDGSPREG